MSAPTPPYCVHCRAESWTVYLSENRQMHCVCCGNVMVDAAPPADPRIEAWRALDAEQRSYRVEDLRTWADMVEAGVAPDGADHGPSPLRIAAAALEAIAEPRP